MDRLSDVLELAPLLKAKGEAFVLATVVRTVAATAAKAGAKAIIRADGSISEGWIGGGCARGAVLKAAREALADGRARLISVQPPDVLQAHGVAAGDEREGVRFAKNTCPSQGTMDIFIEPVLPRPQIVLCGSSPVAVAIADLAPRLGFSVTACAPAAEQAAFAEADRRIDDYALPATEEGERFIVVSTQSRGDERALTAALLDRRPLRRFRRQPAESADVESSAGGARRRRRASDELTRAGRARPRRHRPGGNRALDHRRDRRLPARPRTQGSGPMTSSACLAAPAPSRREIAARNTPLLFVGLTALPLGLLLDRRFGLLPALTARCGGAETLLGALRWHWSCMPATCLMMLFAAPAWIGIEALARAGRAGSARRDRGTGALAACGCHLAMLIGMASTLGAGPELVGARRPAVDRRRGDRGDGVRHGWRNGSGVRVRSDQDPAIGPKADGIGAYAPALLRSRTEIGWSYAASS